MFHESIHVQEGTARRCLSTFKPLSVCPGTSETGRYSSILEIPNPGIQIILELAEALCFGPGHFQGR